MYDVVVLGGGPGGYEAAALAGKNGLSVCLIEKKQIGGTCLNEGCIPLKYYLNFAKTERMLQQFMKQGLIDIESKCIDPKKIVVTKNLIISVLQQSVEAMLHSAGVELWKANGIIQSVAPEKVVVSTEEGEVQGKRLIIATGSCENRMQIDSNRVNYNIGYSNDMLQLEQIPETVVIVGAGVIGLETASYYADLGSKVTVVDICEHIGGSIDGDIGKTLQQIMKKQGVRFFLGYEVKEFLKEGILIQRQDERQELTAEFVMIAVGRKPKVDDIGLNECGIVYSKKGIEIDEKCRTNQSNVYACGDVTGKMMLAHAAYHQARVIVNDMLGISASTTYELVPQIIYSNPEILTLGYTEDRCKQDNIEYIVKSLPMTYSGKYYVEHGRDNAISKLIFNKKSEQLIGVHMMGNTVSEMALFFELVMKNKMTRSQLEDLIYPHPTVSEIIKELVEK